jgi:predicted secreted protein
MATTGPFNGRTLGLYVGGVLQAYTTSNSLSINGTVINITSKDSSLYRSILMGTKWATITVNGLVALDSTVNADKLGDLLIAGTSAVCKFSTNTSGDRYWYFTGYVTSCSIDSPNDAPVTYSATIESTDTVYSVAKT